MCSHCVPGFKINFEGSERCVETCQTFPKMDHAINNEVFLKGKKNAIDLTPLVSINHIIIIAGGGVLFKQGKEGVNWKN